MFKNKLFVTGVVVVVLVATLVFRIVFLSDAPTSSQYPELPDVSLGEFDSNDQTEPGTVLSGPSVLSVTGQRVQVRDFSNDADTFVFTPETIVLGEEEGLVDTQYRIFYFPEDGSITISLLSEPLHISRELAQEELATSLGLSEALLCSFTIRVTTPRTVSDPYAGRNLGLSFCDTSVSLN